MHTFVLYPRSDEAHMFQAIIQGVPVIFVLLFQIEKLVIRRDIKRFRNVFALAVGLACSTIVTVPGFEVFAADQGDEWTQVG